MSDGAALCGSGQLGGKGVGFADGHDTDVVVSGRSQAGDCGKSVGSGGCCGIPG